jgi:aspartate aminotransferase-like enzyme
MEARFARHARIAKAIRAGLVAVGLELFTSPDRLADTLSVVRYPEGVDDVAFRAAMAEQGVIVAAALGPIAGKAYRLGHMGNIGTPEVTRALQAIETSLTRSGREVAPGTAVAAAEELL